MLLLILIHIHNHAQNLRLFKLLYLYKQLDGRPMSGDIGRGATRETVSFAVHLSSMSNRPPGKQSQSLEKKIYLVMALLSSTFLSIFY